MADRLGVVFVELDLDKTKFEKGQQQIIQQANSTALSIEKNYQILGVKSDNIFNAMAQGARNAYERIAASSKTSASEQYRAQAAMVAKINSLNQEMTRNPLYETLGIRSVAAIEAQKQAVIRSFNTIRQHVQKGSQDWINIERAKNEKLKELNKEMVGQHDWSMAAMTRAVLRFYAAYYVISAAVRAVGSAFMDGVATIDKMQLSAVTVAATITNLQGTTGDVAENYKKNLEYAKGLVPVLMQIDAASLANLEQVQRINNAMAMHGVILDGSNKKQVESATALTNAIAMYTVGQSKEQQATQETNALLNGEITTRNRIALMVDQMIKRQGDYKDGLKGLNEEARKHGDWLERIHPYFVGIAAAAGDISKTWEAIRTSLQTTWMILQTEIFADFYKGLVTGGQEAVGWARENASEIGKYFRISFNAVGDAIGAVWGVLRGFVPVMQDIAPLVALIAYGWGGVLAAIKPIGEFLGNTIALIYRMGQALVQATLAGAAALTGNKELMKTYWDEAKKNWAEVEKLAARNKFLMTDGIVDAIEGYDKLYDAKKKAAGTGYVPKVPPGGESEDKIKAREAAEKQITEAIRRNVYEREAIGKDAYEKDIIRINEEVEKYKEAGVSNVLIAKYVAGEMAIAEAKRNEEIIKATEKNAEQLVASWAKYYENKDKQAKADAKAIEDYEKETAKKTIKTWTDATKDAIEAMERDIALGVKQTMDSLSGPQKEADEARKMVTFYQDMIGMEDEYRQAKLDWIEKEANVKFAGMDKELLKERWMKEQRIKFEQEIFDAKAKQIQQGLGDMSSMFQSLSGMYDKNSGEYARLQEAANAMIILQKAVAVVNAVSAVAAAAAAPFPAGFVAMASMAAAMGSLLGSIGLSIGGGSISTPSAAYGLNTPVLGGANNEGSQSIQKSWELLQDTYDMENTRLTNIYNEMKQLNLNITGIVRGIVQGDMGLMSVGTGYSQSGMANLFNGILKTASNLATLASGVIIAGSAYMGVLAASAAAGPVGWAVMAALVVDKVLGLGIVDKVIGGISNFIFGSSTTAQTASGIMVGGGVVSPYTQTHTEKKGMFGGLFGGGGSSDSRIVYEANATLTNLFYGPNGIYTTLKSSVTSMATLLGADVAKAESKVFEAFELNFIGKTADQIQEIVSAKISEIGDEFAREVFGGLIDIYQKVGEGALETVNRLAVDMVVVSDLIAMTGKSFSGTNESIIALSESLIGLAGGLDKLSESASTYYDKFFSDEEKQLRLQGLLTQALEAHNLPLVESREGYRALVEALDLTVEWQREAYVNMIQWAEAADQYYSYLEEALEEATNAQNDYVESLKNISLTIQEWLNNLNLSTLSPVQSEAEWTRQYIEAKTKASLSGASEQDVNAYLSFATKYLEMQQKYGTSESYRAIYDAVVGDVTGMQAGKNLALELAQRQLDALNAIVANTATTAAASILTAFGGNINMAELPPEQTAAIIENINTVDWAKVAEDMYVPTNLFAPVDEWWSGPYASGGYADSPTIFGEAGGEWAVPTYEPQRSNFLKKAPAQFWDNLGLNGGSNGPGGEVTVHSHIYLDGKEIQTCVSKGLKTNPDLIQSARRAVN